MKVYKATVKYDERTEASIDFSAPDIDQARKDLIDYLVSVGFINVEVLTLDYLCEPENYIHNDHNGVLN